MKKILLLIAATNFYVNIFSQVAVDWQRCYGSSYYDPGRSGQQTSDGGYIVAGGASGNNGDVTGLHGGYDFWMVKLDAAGNIQWQKCLGGTGSDRAYDIQQTTDGGYIVVGSSASNDVDVTGNHGLYDMWVVKVDSIGNIIWQKSLGGSADEFGYSIRQTTDGGYIASGITNSTDGDVTGYHVGSGWDYWVVKLSAVGNLQWQKALGSTDDDRVNSVIQTADGGYIVSGYTQGYDGDVTNSHGSSEAWVVKLDTSGNIQWSKCYGGYNVDAAMGIIETTEGGFAIAAMSNSTNGDVSGNHGGLDAWIIKISNTGTIQWQKCLGGTQNEFAFDIKQTMEGGFIVGACASSTDGDVTGYHGGIPYDYWVVKLSMTGIIEWQKCLGGSGQEGSHVLETPIVMQTSADSYVLFGNTLSNDGDVFGNHDSTGTYEDFWFVKLTETYNTMTGQLFADVNSNAVLDGSEVGIAHHRVNEINTGRFTFSHLDGSYNLTVLDTGNFIESPVSISNFNPVPAQHSAYFSGIHQTDSLNDFAFQPTTLVTDLFVSITPAGAFRPGFNSLYTIHYENRGSTISTPTLIFFKDNFLSWVSSSILPASVTTDSIVWTLPALLPFQDGNISLTMSVNSGTPLGTFVHCYARIEPIAGDINPSNNYGGWETPLVVTASHDPNEILVNRPSVITTELTSPPFLNYVIYFQNTGTDTAFTVRIENPLPASLNESTMELEGLSDEANIQYNPVSRNLEIIFNNIHLPDSTTDEQGSHGYIHYRIKPVSALAAGDTIKNQAWIYFDYNAPIVTNTAMTRIVTPVASSINSTDVSCFGGANGSASVNPSGGTPPYTYQWSAVASTAQSVSNLSAGIYFVTVTDADGYTAIATATIYEPPALSLLANQTNIGCSGNSNGSANAAAGGGTPGYSYLWNTIPPQVTAAAIALSAGLYTVTVTDANGCMISTSQNIIEHPLPTASISLSGPTTFCQGDSVILTSIAANSYLWSNSSTSQSINVTSSGSYAVTVTDVNACTASTSLSVTVNPNPPAPAITQAGDSLISDAATTYQWYFNSVLIPGATSQSYHPTQNGNYSVVITDANNCSASSTDYPFVLTRTGDLTNENEISIYPNPVQGELVVRSSEFPARPAGGGDKTEITICNLLGEQLLNKKPAARSQQQVIDVSALTAGIYFLEVRTQTGVQRRKFMKM